MPPKPTRKRIIFVIGLIIVGFLMAQGASFIIGMQHPIRQESQLLDNYYLILQSLHLKSNLTPDPNLTYVVGSTGMVVSFNDLLTEQGYRYKRNQT